MNHKNFWTVFTQNSGRMAAAFRAGRTELVFDEIGNLLTLNDCNFCFDVTERCGVCYLIFSPEGNHEEAVLIDSCVAAAPEVNGWRFFNRRQPKELSDLCVIIYNLFLIDLELCRFQVLGSCPLVRIYIPENSDITEAEQVGFGNTVLWHALGEDYVMSARIKSEVKLGIPQEGKTLILKEFINYRRGQGQN